MFPYFHSDEVHRLRGGENPPCHPHEKWWTSDHEAGTLPAITKGSGMKAAHAAAEMIGGEFKVPEACFIGTTMNQNPRHPFHLVSPRLRAPHA